MSASRSQLINASQASERTTLPPIAFFIPQADFPPEGVPDSMEVYPKIWRAIYSWTLQTYLQLKAVGFPCTLVDEMPTEGIVVVHRDSLNDDQKPVSPNLLMICVKAERDPHPCAQLHVVQNPMEAVGLSRVLWNSYYMPHWTQPNLIPRDPERGDRFETIVYFGRGRNLAPELQDPSWQTQLEAMGLRWQVINAAIGNDYSQVDAVLAVRSFDKQGYPSKPATKLFNAWHAGVPALMGYDSAFRAERRSELDYLEVTSVEDTIAALQRLRDDRELRHRMVENGLIRSRETDTAQLVKRWQDLLINVAVPAYEAWIRSSDVTRQAWWVNRSLGLKLLRFQNQLLQRS